MKKFSMVFILSFFFFFIAMYIGANSYIQEKNIELENNIGAGFYENISIGKTIVKKLEVEPKEPEVYSSLEEAIEKSNRVNFLILGMEDVRTDTIILGNFCPDSKKLDLISIPRDTYIHRKGYNSAEQRKINSVNGVHGIPGIKKTVSHILDGIPISYYITLDYKGVEKIIDELGGVEVDVPFHMKYSDIASDPPLNIDISPGRQTLNGKRSLDFLRYRKGNNNKGGYIDGDLGRIRAQQDFIKSFIEKAQEDIITVLRKGITYVKTDASIVDLLSYGRKSIGMTKDDLNLTILPGKAEFKKVNKRVLSYYIYDKSEVTKLLEKIYNVKKD